MTELFLGVDAGNSKTLAAVADGTGRILGWARGGLGDIYGAPEPEITIQVVLDVARRAVAEAGVEGGLGAVRSAAFRLAGVDWPEDEALWSKALGEVLPDDVPRSVKNDGFALLRCGEPDGVGVAVSIGTGAAIGARGSTGDEFVVSWWFQHYLGAAGLGTDAVRAVMLSELGLAEPTALSGALVDFYGSASVEDLLHAFTRREQPLGHHDKGRAARLILATAAEGDGVAESIVAAHAARIADYVAVSAKRVGLRAPTVVLGGSVVAAPDSILRALAVQALRDLMPSATVVSTRAVPILGAVLDAIAEGGVRVDRAVQARVLAAELPDELLRT
jgi:N-acetylglucosamine kinase-like BadF-type ATPase